MMNNSNLEECKMSPILVIDKKLPCKEIFVLAIDEYA